MSVEESNRRRNKGGCVWEDKDGYLIKDWVAEDGARHRARVHRMVMSTHLGRELSKDEIVHHKNGNKKDNRVENLEIIDGHRLHKLLHHGEPWNKGRVTINKHVCRWCGVEFETIRQPGRRYCSRECSSKAGLKIMNE